MEGLKLERDGGVAVVTLDRPERRNAMHPPMWAAVAEAGEQLAADPPRAVVLTGAGEHFCSGMDLSPSNTIFQRVMQCIQSRDQDGLQAIIVELKSQLNAIATIGAPVIVAIEGACLGAGLELALCGDIRICGEGARFSLPETRWGMVPDVGGTTRLTKLIGRGRAAQLILTAATIDAEKAESWGLVSEKVPRGAALERALELAEAISACSPAATREALLTMRGGDGRGDDQRFADETAAGARALLSGEVLEGITSFLEKRPARW